MNFLQKGEYFGYPLCCIQSFITQFNNIHNVMPTNYISNNTTGFLPCYTCSKRVLSGEIKIKDLITNRECETEFPNGDGYKILLDNNATIILIEKDNV